MLQDRKERLHRWHPPKVLMDSVFCICLHNPRLAMAEDKVLSYGDSLLLQDDVLLLAGPHWLNDKVPRSMGRSGRLGDRCKGCRYWGSVLPPPLPPAADASSIHLQLIGFYFEYLATEVVPRRGVVLVPGAETFLLANLGPAGGAVVLEPLGFAACRLALLAVNDNPDASAAEGGSHWSLLAYSPADNTFLHYDSCRGANAGAARQVYEAARASCPPGARLAEQRSPQQANGWVSARSLQACLSRRL